MRNGEPRFFAADACKLLGHSNPTKALYALGDDEKETVNLTICKGARNYCLISESGLYKLILRAHPSRPQVKRFQDWVTKTVLPAIRKDGAYIMGENGQLPGAWKQNVGCWYISLSSCASSWTWYKGEKYSPQPYTQHTGGYQHGCS